MVAWRAKQVPTMSRIDIEENTRDDDRLLLQQLFEEGLQPRRIFAALVSET